MNKKLKIRKEVLYVSALIVLLIFILIIRNIFKTKDYEIEYEKDKYNITERYLSKEKKYLYSISKGKIKYSFYTENEYTKDRKLIKKIDEYSLENESCIEVKSDAFKINILCNNGENIDSRLVSNEMKELIGVELKEENEPTEYQYIKIYDTLGYDFILWDYKNFLRVNESVQKTSILSADSYDISLVGRLNEYLIVPDYDSKYSFNKFYIYNMKNGTKEEMKMGYDISFESYIAGSWDKSIYLVDKKNKVEYEIVPHKKKIRIVGTSYKSGVILKDNNLVKESMTKIISDEKKFEYNELIKYEIIDEKIYQIVNEDKTLLSNNKIDSIVDISYDTVCYLSGENLYLYNPSLGEQKVISNFEWNFNNKNMIFLYIP